MLVVLSSSLLVDAESLVVAAVGDVDDVEAVSQTFCVLSCRPSRRSIVEGATTLSPPEKGHREGKGEQDEEEMKVFQNDVAVDVEGFFPLS